MLPSEVLVSDSELDESLEEYNGSASLVATVSGLTLLEAGVSVLEDASARAAFLALARASFLSAFCITRANEIRVWRKSRHLANIFGFFLFLLQRDSISYWSITGWRRYLLPSPLSAGCKIVSLSNTVIRE
jgi:hypothetical protein